MKNRDIYWRRCKKHCTWDKDAWVFFKVGTLGLHTVLPITLSCPVVFSWISLTVWNVFPFEGDFSFGKSQRSQASKSGLLGVLSHLCNCVIWCFTKKFCVGHDAWVGTLSWWSCWSPVAHSCGLLNHLTGFSRWMLKLNRKFDADSLLYSSVLNATATQYTCSLNSVCCSHWLV